VIRGRVAERRLAENYFTLWDEKMNTVDVLSGHDLVLDADRRFTIWVDSDPKATARIIRSAPEARVLHPRRPARLVEGRAERADDRALGAPPYAAADAREQPSSLPATCAS
jgi:hypothetical protein